MLIGGSIQWDPNPIFWVIPGINLAIAWYGVLFALGFLLGYFIMVRQVRHELGCERKEATAFTDRILLCSIVGTVAGARLGYVFFYGWPWFQEHPMAIFNIREGGLASHGGVIGVLASLVVARWTLKSRFPSMTLLRTLDRMVIPVALVAAFIRLGNFMNQELVGTPSDLPWAVLFVHPADNLSAVARHPVQLYESLAYLSVFVVTWLGSRTSLVTRRGALTGLFFMGIFGFRFLFEFVKERTGLLLPADSVLSMGQLLSLPMIGIGLAVFTFAWVRKPVTS